MHHLVALALLHIPQPDLMRPGCHIDQGRGQRGVLQAQSGRRAQRGRDRLNGMALHSSSAMKQDNYLALYLCAGWLAGKGRPLQKVLSSMLPQNF